MKHTEVTSILVVDTLLCVMSVHPGRGGSAVTEVSEAIKLHQVPMSLMQHNREQYAANLI